MGDAAKKIAKEQSRGAKETEKKEAAALQRAEQNLKKISNEEKSSKAKERSAERSAERAADDVQNDEQEAKQAERKADDVVSKTKRNAEKINAEAGKIKPPGL